MTRLPALIAAFVYTALAAFANPALSRPLTEAERGEVTDLRDGDMRKLIVHETAIPAPDTTFTDAAGAGMSLADSNGRVRLVNFWATWCAPCRIEKPSLDALERELGGEDFEVIAIATGRNSLEAIEDFNAQVGVTALETHLDPKSTLAAAMNVPGLPVTVILDRDGAEIGRLMGGADWNTESARAIVSYLTGRD